MNLIPLIPTTKQKHTTGQKSSFEDSNECPTNNNGPPIIRPSHTQHDHAPTQCKSIQLKLWSYVAKREGTRHFKQEISDEEDEKSDGIAITDVEAKINVHACCSGVGKIYAVETGDAVEGAEDGDEAEVNFAPSELR